MNIIEHQIIQKFNIIQRRKECDECVIIMIHSEMRFLRARNNNVAIIIKIIRLISLHHTHFCCFANEFMRFLFKTFFFLTDEIIIFFCELNSEIGANYLMSDSRLVDGLKACYTL